MHVATENILVDQQFNPVIGAKSCILGHLYFHYSCAKPKISTKSQKISLPTIPIYQSTEGPRLDSNPQLSPRNRGEGHRPLHPGLTFCRFRHGKAMENAGFFTRNHEDLTSKKDKKLDLALDSVDLRIKNDFKMVVQ